MKIRNTRLIAALIAVAATTSLSADQIRLRSGKVVDGTLVGADSKAVRLLLANGTRAEFPIGDVEVIGFSARKPPPPPPDPARAPAAVMVPGGTAINVRLTQGIDVDATKAGTPFKAIVDDPVMVAGKVVIPRGASAALEAVKVQQSGTMKGSDKIALKMNSVSIGRRVYQIATQTSRAKAPARARRRPGRSPAASGSARSSAASLAAVKARRSARWSAGSPGRRSRAPARSTSRFRPRRGCSSS